MSSLRALIDRATVDSVVPRVVTFSMAFGRGVIRGQCNLVRGRDHGVLATRWLLDVLCWRCA